MKILKGTARARINFNEPKLTSGDIMPPAHLKGLALDHWNELAPMLFEAGLLTKVDRPALAHLCQAYVRTQDPEAADAAHITYLRLLTEFGLTPAARTRISMPAAKEKDRLGEFLGKKKA